MTCRPLPVCDDVTPQSDPLTGIGPLGVTPQGAEWEDIFFGAARGPQGGLFAGLYAIRRPCSCDGKMVVEATLVEISEPVVAILDAWDGFMGHGWVWVPADVTTFGFALTAGWNAIYGNRAGVRSVVSIGTTIDPAAGDVIRVERQGIVSYLYVNGVLAGIDSSVPDIFGGIGGSGLGGRVTWTDFSASCSQQQQQSSSLQPPEIPWFAEWWAEDLPGIQGYSVTMVPDRTGNARDLVDGPTLGAPISISPILDLTIFPGNQGVTLGLQGASFAILGTNPTFGPPGIVGDFSMAFIGRVLAPNNNSSAIVIPLNPGNPTDNFAMGTFGSSGPPSRWLIGTGDMSTAVDGGGVVDDRPHLFVVHRNSTGVIELWVDAVLTAVATTAALPTLLDSIAFVGDWFNDLHHGFGWAWGAAIAGALTPAQQMQLLSFKLARYGA